MLCVAEFTIPPESFPFGETLVREQNVEIEVDQIVPTDESALPFFWVRGCDPEEFMAYAEQEEDVEDTRELERVGDTALFRAEWSPNAAVVDRLKELDMTIIEFVGTAEHWRFEVRTPDRDVFNQFREAFEDQGIPITLNRLYDMNELLDSTDQDLTENQRETLLTAYQRGYFDEPRAVTQAELSVEFDVSRRAVSERLRRGTRNLIEASLLPGGRAE